MFAIAGLVLLLVAAAVTWCVYRFRDRGQPIPKQTHGRPALEIGLTILPAMILIGVAIPTVGTLMALAEDRRHGVRRQRHRPAVVVGDRLPGPGRLPRRRITEPIVTSGQLVIPGTPTCCFAGTSSDVIHSFWVPRINGKRDVVPGRIQTLRLEADEPGIYAGQCAEFCGLSHANMRMEIVALERRGLRGRGSSTSWLPYEAPGGGHAGGRRPGSVHRQHAPAATRSTVSRRRRRTRRSPIQKTTSTPARRRTSRT